MSEGHGRGLGDAIVYRGDDPQEYIKQLERELAEARAHRDHLLTIGRIWQERAEKAEAERDKALRECCALRNIVVAADERAKS